MKNTEAHENATAWLTPDLVNKFNESSPSKSVNPNDYEVSRGHIDESGQIADRRNGHEIIGCPGCGSVFAWDCFCGFVEKKQ